MNTVLFQGFVPEVEGALKGSDDMRFKGMIPGHVPNIFASHDRNVGLSASDKASQTRYYLNFDVYLAPPFYVKICVSLFWYL